MLDAYKIRNRLTYPKQSSDLDISKDDMATVGGAWNRLAKEVGRVVLGT